jgi:hypothetical protein
MLPLEATTWIVKYPGTEDAVDMVSLAAAVAFAAKVMEVEFRESAGPLELKTKALNATVPWKPRMLVRVIVEDAFIPSWRVKREGLTVMRRSGPVTFTATDACRYMFALLPDT